jgi:hypothetical protein
VRLDVTAGGEGTCTFAALAARLREPGQIPIAVELRKPDGEHRLCVGQGEPEREDAIDLAELEAVWVIRADSAPAEATARHATIPVTSPVST